jgi:hypothetical protein
MFLPSRRNFLQTAVAAVASLFLPRSLRAAAPNPAYWFLHTESGASWPVDDPVAWALENAGKPLLERARARLVTLDAADPQRVIRLVVRRCSLNLLEVRPGRVVVHYWGQAGRADLRPFFKRHRLARRAVAVRWIDRKRERSAVLRGDEFLYGAPLGWFFPVGLYRAKWRRRGIAEAGDRHAAPCSDSNYCWDGVPPRCIPWGVLKSAWRHEEAPPCRNCDGPTLVKSFGYFVCGFYKRGPVGTRVCLRCRRGFEDNGPWDGPGWLRANLEEALLPSWDLMFGRPVRYTLPWTAEGRAHELILRMAE